MLRAVKVMDGIRDGTGWDDSMREVKNMARNGMVLRAPNGVMKCHTPPIRTVNDSHKKVYKFYIYQLPINTSLLLGCLSPIIQLDFQFWGYYYHEQVTGNR